MSRIGKLPVPISKDVKVKWAAPTLTATGPKGSLSVDVLPPISVELEEDQVKLLRPDDSRQSRSLHGLYRSLVANAVLGVTKGFSKQLDIIGVGYKAEIKGSSLIMALGFSHPVDYSIPEGAKIEVEKTRITVSGIDKQLVGQVAADIRRYRPPEPYKGKGIRYVDERVRRKAGKAAVSSSG